MTKEEFEKLSSSEQKEFLFYLGKPNLAQAMDKTVIFKELFSDSKKVKDANKEKITRIG